MIAAPRRPARQEGAVALEFALLLPVVAVLLLLVLQLVGVAGDALAVQGLASRAARAAALDGPAAARSLVAGRMPDAHVVVRRAGSPGVVSVQVVRTRHVAGRPVTVTGAGAALVEP